MEDEKIKDAILSLASENDDYDSHAYFFVNGAVSHTVEKISRDPDGQGARHVSGKELIEGALDFAILQYDFLAPQVFEYWGLRAGSDLGAIVYRMIGAGILSAGKNDRVEDFDGPEDLPALLRERLRNKAASDRRRIEPRPLPPISK